MMMYVPEHVHNARPLSPKKSVGVSATLHLATATNAERGLSSPQQHPNHTMADPWK
jgi:hypothetical protein